MGIADSYDAMTVCRAYRTPMGHARVREILREESGRKHEPQPMAIFPDIIAGSQFRDRGRRETGQPGLAARRRRATAPSTPRPASIMT